MAEPPLFGLAIVVTRPAAQGRGLAEGLERLGAEVGRVPLVEIAPVEDQALLDRAAEGIDGYEWVVFTSANGVRAFGERLPRGDRMPRVAVVGPATADALRERGVEPAFVGEGAAESIAAGLDGIEGARVLLPQADIATSELASALRDRGALVDVVTAYRTVSRTPTDHERRVLEEADAIVLASGSAARSLVSLEPVGERALIVCIGPKTASAAREVGLRVGVVADETTADGIIRALVEHYGERT